MTKLDTHQAIIELTDDITFLKSELERVMEKLNMTMMPMFPSNRLKKDGLFGEKWAKQRCA